MRLVAGVRAVASRIPHLAASSEGARAAPHLRNTPHPNAQKPCPSRRLRSRLPTARPSAPFAGRRPCRVGLPSRAASHLRGIRHTPRRAPPARRLVGGRGPTAAAIGGRSRCVGRTGRRGQRRSADGVAHDVCAVCAILGFGRVLLLRLLPPPLTHAPAYGPAETLRGAGTRRRSW